jgi:hypothetical protein
MEAATISREGRASSVLSDPATDATPVGRFHCWWRGDPLPLLPQLPGLTIEPASDLAFIARLAGIKEAEVVARRSSGHQPWLARVTGVPVGWGWCATAELDIGELGITRTLPERNRYLWDFVTVPSWRGRRIYPRLLQAIVRCSLDADRFWIGHDQPNVASARGISRAGFQEVGVLYVSDTGDFELVPTASPPRIAAASALFGVPIIGGSFADRTSDDIHPRTTI